MLALAAEPEVGHHLGRDRADGSERAGVGLPRSHGSHRATQIRREPRWSEGMARKRGGLDAGAVVVIRDIFLFLPGRVCRRKHEIKAAAICPRDGLFVWGIDRARHQAASGSETESLVVGKAAR